MVKLKKFIKAVITLLAVCLMLFGFFGFWVSMGNTIKTDRLKRENISNSSSTIQDTTVKHTAKAHGNSADIVYPMITILGMGLFFALHHTFIISAVKQQRKDQIDAAAALKKAKEDAKTNECIKF